jgi:hypothetical protein
MKKWTEYKVLQDNKHWNRSSQKWNLIDDVLRTVTKWGVG